MSSPGRTAAKAATEAHTKATCYNNIHDLPALSLSKAQKGDAAAMVAAQKPRHLSTEEEKRSLYAERAWFRYSTNVEDIKDATVTNWALLDAPITKKDLGLKEDEDEEGHEFLKFEIKDERYAHTVDRQYEYVKLYPKQRAASSKDKEVIVREQVLPNNGLSDKIQDEDGEEEMVEEPSLPSDIDDVPCEGALPPGESDDDVKEYLTRWDYPSLRPISVLNEDEDGMTEEEACALAIQLEKRHRAAKAVEPNAFLLHNVLSADECGYLMKAAEPLLEPVDQHFEQRYRLSDRALIKSEKLADEIFRRILPHFNKEKDLDGRIPLCFGHDGQWLPLGCNECIKIMRYSPGGHFTEHRDAPWIPSEDQASIYTVLIYLNEEFRGGATHFTMPEDATKDIGPYGQRTLGYTTSTCVVPSTGTALLFNHDLWHSGYPVMNGAKWVLRTEVIFQRVSTHLVDKFLHVDDKDFLKTKTLYEESMAALKDGDRAGFADKYQAVIGRQREAMIHTVGERAKAERLLSRLNDDAFGDVLSFLEDCTLVQLLTVSKASYYGILQSSIWEIKTLQRFPEAISEVGRIVLGQHSDHNSPGQETALPPQFPFDWKRVYSQRCLLTRRFYPASLVVSEGGLVASVDREAPVQRQYNNHDEYRYECCYRRLTLDRNNTSYAPLQPNTKTVVVRFGNYFISNTGDPLHMNVPICERFNIEMTMPQALKTTKEDSVIDSNKHVGTIVRRDGSVGWSTLTIPLTNLVATIWVPLLVAGHPAWFVGSMEEQRACLNKHQRDLFILLRTPAVSIIHPALALLAHHYHTTGKFNNFRTRTEEPATTAGGADDSKTVVLMKPSRHSSTVYATVVSTASLTVEKTVSLREPKLSLEISDYLKTVCVERILIANLDSYRSDPGGDGDDDYDEEQNDEDEEEEDYWKGTEEVKELGLDAEKVVEWAAADDENVAQALQGTVLLAESMSFRDLCCFKP